MINFHDTSRAYIAKGWGVLPVKEHGKSPYKGYGWAGTSLSTEECGGYPSTLNVGVIMGERSNGLTDLDFDVPEASIIGLEIFAAYPSFGRKSSRHSHRIVRCPDAGKTTKFSFTKEELDIVGFEKGVVLEVRCDGSYTVLPPSTHESGEAIRWHGSLPDKLPEVAYEELVKKAALCAFLAVVLKKYPMHSGIRDEVCMALAGALVRAGLAPDEVDDLIVYVAEQKGDEEASKRRKAHASKERLDAGDEVSGLPKLCELLGIKALEKKLSKWLYGSTLSVLPPAEPEIEELNKRFFVVESEGGKCRVAFLEKQPVEKNRMRDTLVLQSFADFSHRYMHKQVVIGHNQDGKPILKPLGKYWLSHLQRRQYEQIIFHPGQEALPNTYNLWRGFAYVPNMGTWRRMRKHIWLVLAKGDHEAFKYIFKWAAWSVQNPADPAEVALVFRGGKGTGKGTFCRWLTLLFGQHGLQIFSANHFAGRFNGHLRDCVLLFADEAVAPNSKDAENILKGMLTEPTLPIEGKGRDVIQVPNHLHVVMASNSDWVISASSDERRFAMFDVSNAVAGQKDWFTPLDEEMKNGGAEAMLYALLNYDLKGWHPRDHIPSNDALNNQRMQSLHGPDRIYFDWLYTGDVDGQKCGESAFVSTSDFAKLASVNPTVAGRYLKEMGCKQDRNRRPSGWLIPPLAEARKIWNKTRFEQKWDRTATWNIVPPMSNPPVF